MAGQFRSNRLRPPLMWAFRNAAETRQSREHPEPSRVPQGETTVLGRKGSRSAAVTEPVLRGEVWRDLDHLLNAVALESTLDEVRALPHVRVSVLNFGLPDIAHRSIDELMGNDRAVEREIEAALRAYEPRLVAGTIRVSRDTAVDASGIKVRFNVRADLSCRPVDIPLEFTADVEIDSGRFAIDRL